MCGKDRHKRDAFLGSRRGVGGRLVEGHGDVGAAESRGRSGRQGRGTMIARFARVSDRTGLELQPARVPLDAAQVQREPVPKTPYQERVRRARQICGIHRAASKWAGPLSEKTSQRRRCFGDEGESVRISTRSVPKIICACEFQTQSGERVFLSRGEKGAF